MLTQAQLKKLLHYDPLTGIFIRLKTVTYNARKGDIAGCPTSKGYLTIDLLGKKYKSHRLAWLYVYGCWPKHNIDHKDRRKDNNAVDNLRDEPQLENLKNSRMHFDNTSGHNGISWDKKACKWYAKITVNYKQISLGKFTDKDDAIAARQAANIKYKFSLTHGLKA